MKLDSQIKWDYEFAKKCYLEGMSLSEIERRKIANRHSLAKYLKMDDIEIVNRQNVSRIKDESIFEYIDTEAKAYWLGFLYADGYVSKGQNYISIALSVKDEDHIDKFVDFLEIQNPKTYNEKLKSCKISFSSIKMKQDLIKHGCVPQKSLILKFPEIREDLRHHFIRGYFDGDGSISTFETSKMKLRTTVLGTYDFLEKLLESANIDKKIYKHDNVFWINMTIKKSEQFLNYMYKDATIYLTRKKKLYDNYIAVQSSN